MCCTPKQEQGTPLAQKQIKWKGPDKKFNAVWEQLAKVIYDLLLWTTCRDDHYYIYISDKLGSGSWRFGAL